MGGFFLLAQRSLEVGLSETLSHVASRVALVFYSFKLL